jgi:hypothetical protein
MRSWRSIRSGLTYESTADGLVHVVNPRLGREGLFNPDGSWHSGELRYCGVDQHHMIVWTFGFEALQAGTVETYIADGRF